MCFNVNVVLIGCCRDAHYKIPPMDQSKLEYFRTVKEITGKTKVCYFVNNPELCSFMEKRHHLTPQVTC